MIWIYMVVDAAGAQVSLCVDDEELCYNDYDEMH